MDPREGRPADPEGAFPLTLHPEGPPIFHPCTTAAPTWTSPLSIPEPPPAQMRTWDGVTLQVLNTEPQNPITYPCTPNITPRPPQSTKQGCPAVTPPHTPASPSVWGVPWVGGSVGRMTSWVGGSWERGKTGCMVLGMEVGKAGGRFWCSAGWPMPGEGGEGQKGAVSSGVRGAAPCSHVPPSGTDRRSAPPSRWRGCGCGAANACAPGVRGQPGPPRAALLAERSPPPSSGGG